MNLMMKSIIIHSAYDLRIQNYPLEAFGENEIEITTSVGGVCYRFTLLSRWWFWIYKA